MTLEYEQNITSNICWNISHFSYTTSSSGTLDPRCDLSLDQGTCRNYSIYWYYDKQANSCAQFWYGGCGGNDNRYETEDECKRTCVLNRKGNIRKFLVANICSFFKYHYWILYYFPQQDKGEENIRKWTSKFFNLLIFIVFWCILSAVFRKSCALF